MVRARGGSGSRYGDLEWQVGMRVYLRPLESTISGLFAYTEAAGACVLLNANHPRGRIAQTGAHELGHFITTREEPELLVEQDTSRSREEQYAAAFARSFLTPGRAVRQRFGELTAGQSTRRHVILLAHSFAVSREAMVRRLEELRVVRKGTWDWFQDNGGITDAQFEDVIGHPPDEGRTPDSGGGIVPTRVGLLVREAWKRDLYSEGQLADLLALDRLAVRELVEGAEEEKAEAAERVALPGIVAKDRRGYQCDHQPERDGSSRGDLPTLPLAARCDRVGAVRTTGRTKPGTPRYHRS